MCSAASGTISAVSPELPSSTPSWVEMAAITCARHRTGATQGAHQGLVLLHLLADPAYPHAAGLVARRPWTAPRRRRGTARRRPVSPSSARPGIGLPYGDSVGWSSSSSSRRSTVSLITCSQRHASSWTQLPVQADHVDEQALGEPVLAHHPHREAVALVGQLQVAVALDREQPVALHPGHGLADRRAALVQPLRDPGAQGDDALLLELVDRCGGTSRWCRSGRSRGHSRTDHISTRTTARRPATPSDDGRWTGSWTAGRRSLSIRARDLRFRTKNDMCRLLGPAVSSSWTATTSSAWG